MKIGYHIGKTDLINNIKQASIDGANACQLFISSPKIWKTNKLSKSDVDFINEYKITNSMYFVVHGKYLYNFCRDVKEQRDALLSELIEANRIGADVVIHQGKNVKELGMTTSEAQNDFVKNISNIIDTMVKLELKNRIILENSAHQGTELGYTLEDLSMIYNSFSVEHKKYLGICIDLCHIFVAGTIDMRKKEDVILLFKKYKSLFGIETLSVIHFNDSNKPFDSHNDNHYDIYSGYIGNTAHGGSNEGFKQVIKYAKKYSIPLILETPAISSDYKTQILLINQSS